MNQILHIFRKDVRALWYQIAVVLALIAAHAILDPQYNQYYFNSSTSEINSVTVLLMMLLPIGIGYLIALVIFQEALVTERQFWLTRPYHRGKLLIAKALFILIFVNVPLFLSDCYILWTHGFSVADVLPRILLRQIPLTGIFILPPLALATVSTGVSQLLLSCFFFLFSATFGAAFVSALRRRINFNISYRPETLLAVSLLVTIGVFIWQYARRDTTKSRLALIVLAIVISFLTPANWPSEVQASAPKFAKFDTSGIRVSYDINRGRAPDGSWPNRPEGYVSINLPITVSGIDTAKIFRGTGTTRIEVDGKPWPETGVTFGGSLEHDQHAYYWHHLILETFKLESIREKPVRVETKFHLEILNEKMRMKIPIGTQKFFVPGVGMCQSFLDYGRAFLACRSGLGPMEETDVRVGSQRAGLVPSVSSGKGALPWGLSPAPVVAHANWGHVRPDAEFEFLSRYQITTFSSAVNAPSIHLANYIVR